MYKTKLIDFFKGKYIIKTVEKEIDIKNIQESFHLISRQLITKHIEEYKYLHIGSKHAENPALLAYLVLEPIQEQEEKPLTPFELTLVKKLDAIYNYQKEEEETHNYVLDKVYNKLERINRK